MTRKNYKCDHIPNGNVKYAYKGVYEAECPEDAVEMYALEWGLSDGDIVHVDYYGDYKILLKEEIIEFRVIKVDNGRK